MEAIFYLFAGIITASYHLHFYGDDGFHIASGIFWPVFWILTFCNKIGEVLARKTKWLAKD